jgi:hypothetical protein
VGNAAHRAHGAGNDHHGVGGIGTTGKGSVHALEIVRFRAGRQLQPVRQFLADDLLRVIAEDNVQFVFPRVEVIQQPLRIQGAAGSGDRHKNFQASGGGSMARAGGRDKFVHRDS